MPPNIENEPTPPGASPPAAAPPPPPAASPQPSSPPSGGMKVIQPTGNMMSTPDNTAPSLPPQAPPVTNTPAPAADSGPTPTAISQPPVPAVNQVAPGVIAGAGTSSPVTKTGLEEGAKTKKRRKRLIITLVLLAVVILGGAGGFLYWYLPQDHSVYAKLNSASYNQGGVNLSYSYPSILKTDTAKLAQVQSNLSKQPGLSLYALYDYQPTGANKIIFDINSINISNILKPLKLSPQSYLQQIKSGSGSFVDQLNKQSSSAFSSYFNGCNNSIINDYNQMLVVCYLSNNGFTQVSLLGADKDYQYNYLLYMPNAVWNAHPKVWQKVEKSFKY